MNTCEAHDSIVVFSSSVCPVCKMIDGYQNEITTLEDTVSDLEYRNDELETEISELKEEK